MTGIMPFGRHDMAATAVTVAVACRPPQVEIVIAPPSRARRGRRRAPGRLRMRAPPDGRPSIWRLPPPASIILINIGGGDLAGRRHAGGHEERRYAAHDRDWPQAMEQGRSPPSTTRRSTGSRAIRGIGARRAQMASLEVFDADTGAATRQSPSPNSACTANIMAATSALGAHRRDAHRSPRGLSRW